VTGWAGVLLVDEQPFVALFLDRVLDEAANPSLDAL
jgi:hypothetical protein